MSHPGLARGNPVRMPVVVRLPLCCIAFLFAACGGGSPWIELAPTHLDLTQQRQRTKAEVARDELGKALLGRLTEALAKGVPAAIPVCRDVAPTLAAEIGRQQGVTIGRTSLQLRSQRNAIPEWAKAHIEQAAPQPAFFRGPQQQLGVLYPILLQAQCVQCHGAADQIAPEVKAKLQEVYPQDRATGYAEGALRGWFWIEVPGS